MSSTIDNRVVNMTFNNKQFEKGVSQTVKSLADLKKSLEFNGANTGLSNLGSSIKGVTLNPLINAADTVSSRFSNMGIIGTTALMNITNSAVNAGKRIASSLTIDPVKSGFNEYELKMGAIQTIMAGSGASLDVVNAKLAELNKYSDETIYSFADMTQNIGKFINAGVSLDDSVGAIKGISNAAALAGANSEEASRAMYNFSQALSAGYVKLIDWKSIENANMATVSFKNELIKTALAAGQVTDAGDGMYKTLDGNVFNATKNFNDVLQDQWLNTEVLTTTLSDYADSTTEIGKRATIAATEVKTFTQLLDVMAESVQSGWAQTWEAIIGDKDQAVELLTAISGGFEQLMGPSVDARNTALEYWNTFGGREQMIKGLAKIYATFKSVLDGISESFHNIFPRTTGEQLVGMTKAFNTLASSFHLMQWELDSLKVLFTGLFSVIDLGIWSVQTILKAFSEMSGELQFSRFEIAQMAKQFGYFLIGLTATIKESEKFMTVLTGIASILISVGNIIFKVVVGIISVAYKLGEALYTLSTAGNATIGLDSFASLGEKLMVTFTKVSAIISNIIPNLIAIGTIFGTIIVSTLSTIIKLASTVGDALLTAFASITPESINTGFGKVLTIIASIFTAAGKVVDVIKSIAGAIKNNLGDSFTGFNSETFKNILDAGIIAGATVLITKVISFFMKMAKAAPVFIDAVESVTDSLEALTLGIKAEAIMNIAKAIAILVASLIVLSFVPADKLKAATLAMGATVLALFGGTGILSKIMDGKVFSSTGRIVAVMLAISVSLLLLAKAATRLGSIDVGVIENAALAVGILMASLTLATAGIGATSELFNGGALQIAIVMLGMGLAMTMIAKAAKTLGEIKPEILDQAVKQLTILLRTFAAAIALLTAASTFSKNMISVGIGILIIAIAFNKLLDSVEAFSNLDAKKMWQGIGAVGSIFGMLTIFAALSGKGKIGVSSGLGLLAMAKGVESLAGVIILLGRFPLATIAQGVGALAIMLIALGGASKLMSETDMLSAGIAILAISYGIGMLSNSVIKLSTVDPLKLTYGIGALLLTFTGLAAVINHIEEGKLISLGVAIIAIAAGLWILSDAIIRMGALSSDQLVVGLTGLVVGIAALSGLAAILNTFTSGASMIASSIGLVIMATSMLILAKALEKLSVIPFKGLAQGVGALILVMAAFVVAGLLMAPVAVALLAVSAALLLFGGGLALAGLGMTLFAGGLAALVAVASNGAEDLKLVIMNLFTGVAQGLVDSATILRDGAPIMGEAFLAIMLAGLNAMLGIIPTMLQSFLTMILSFGQILVDNIPKFADLTAQWILGMMAKITEYTPAFIEAGVVFIIAMVDGLAAALIDHGPELAEAIGKAFKAIIWAIFKIFGAKTTFAEFESKWDDMVEWIKVTAKKKWTEFKDIGKYLLEGLISGLTSTAEIGKTVSNFVDTIKNGFTNKDALDINSPSAWTEWVGKMVDKGMEKGLNKFMPDVANAAGGVADGAKDGIEEKDLGSVGTTAGENLSSGLASGISSGSAAVSTAAADLLSSWINNKKAFDQLTLAEELVAWTTVQKKYKAGSEERIKIDKEVYRVKKELVEKQLALEEKYAKDSEELEDQRLADVLAREKEYESMLDSRADAIYKTYGLFDDVPEAEEVTGASLITNLENQVESISEWRSTLDALLAKGVNTDLVSELEELGPSSLPQLKALNSLTGDKLTQYQELWELKLSKASDIATTELGSAKETMLNDIDEINAKSKTALELLTDTYNNELQELASGTSTNLQDTLDAWDEKLSELMSLATSDFQGIIDQVNGLDWSGLGKSIAGQISSGYSSGSGAITDTVVDNTYADMKAAMAKNAETVKANKIAPQAIPYQSPYGVIPADVIAASKNKTTKVEVPIEFVPYDEASTADRIFSAGTNLATGLINGTESKTSSIKTSGSSMIDFYIKSAESAAQINSPSKRTFEMGEYLTQGLINGLKSKLSILTDTASIVSAGATSAMEEAIARTIAFIDQDSDIAPVITPVLDLSQVATSASKLASMLGTPSLSSSIKMGDISGSTETSKLNALTALANKLVASGEQGVTNEFNISELVVREQADVEVIARQLYKMQVASRRG